MIGFVNQRSQIVSRKFLVFQKKHFSFQPLDFFFNQFKQQKNNQTNKNYFLKMPKIRTNKTKYPEDWEVVRPKLDDFEQQMREGM